ncbi:MAG: tRNA pseudouridine(38-40) synthase TruA [Myxococcales bacterium]|nr:tRNA pseudouridine(38-40) synthase TruA [Myxococcales bacterium]
MPAVKLVIQFDGTDFHGWQVQDRVRTVQGVLTSALSQMIGAVSLRSSSRTDAGVHAIAMPVVFRTDKTLPMKAYRRGLNAILPSDVSVVDATEVADDFDPRGWSLGKSYRYRIWNHELPVALESRYAWHVPNHLDIAAMNEGGAYLLGEHDFSSFRAAHCDSKSTMRLMHSVRVAKVGDNGLLQVDVCANAFLRNMVRIIVGTLVDVGTGRKKPVEVEKILQARSRPVAGPTAPPHGLFLREVRYP